MRIAYYSDNFFPELSGITDTIITTGEELRRRGHAVLYVAPRYSKRDYRFVHSAEIEKSLMHDARRDLPVVRLPSLRLPQSPTGQSRIAFPVGASFLALRRFRPDVIHTQSPFGAGLEALLLSRLLGVPLVGTNHTPIEEFVRYGIFGLNSPAILARRFFAWYYNRCSYVTAPYPGILRAMREVHFIRPADALPNPVLLDLFKPATAEQKRRAKMERGLMGDTILYSGRLAPEKNVAVIIRAVAEILPRFPHLNLVLTGYGPSEDELKKLVRSFGMEGNVRFTGFVGFERLAEFYAAADIFAIMSTAEMQSLALMQAFASGLPSVAARAHALPYYLTPERGFLVAPGDSKTLAKRFEELLRDPALRLRLGTNAAKFAKELAPECIALRWEDVFSKIAGKA